MTAADVFMDSVPVNTENKKENNHNKVNFFFPEKWLFLQYVSAEEKSRGLEQKRRNRHGLEMKCKHV